MSERERIEPGCRQPKEWVERMVAVRWPVPKVLDGLVRCSKCKQRKTTEEFDCQAGRFHSQCKDCRRASRKDRGGSGKYDPIKLNARARLVYAVKTGKIVKPDVCEDCKQKKPLEGHHHRGYENALDVRWLCRRCHAETHYGARGGL